LADQVFKYRRKRASWTHFVFLKRLTPRDPSERLRSHLVPQTLMGDARVTQDRKRKRKNEFLTMLHAINWQWHLEMAAEFLSGSDFIKIGPMAHGA